MTSKVIECPIESARSLVRQLRWQIIIQVLLVLAIHGDAEAVPIHVYSRDGDLLRIVYQVGRQQMMGIRGEGPLRARCFVFALPSREVPLGKSKDRPRTLDELAHRLGVSADAVPTDITALWSEGGTDWPEGSSDVRDSALVQDPRRPFKLEFQGSHRIYPLSMDGGYLQVITGFEVRILRLEPPRKEYLIRPRSGLSSMIRDHDLRPSDIGTHLRRIDHGIPADWSDPYGYLY